MAHPDTDPAYPEDEPSMPTPEIDVPGGADIPDVEPFTGDPHDGRPHDSVGADGPLSAMA